MFFPEPPLASGSYLYGVSVTAEQTFLLRPLNSDFPYLFAPSPILAPKFHEAVLEAGHLHLPSRNAQAI